MDLILDPCENRLHKDSMKFLNAQSESVCDRGDHHKLELSWSPNPAYANPFPFQSSPRFLTKTRVHMSPWSKFDGQELKSERIVGVDVLVTCTYLAPTLTASLNGSE